jgi:hypothetical protein
VQKEFLDTPPEDGDKLTPEQIEEAKKITKEDVKNNCAEGQECKAVEKEVKVKECLDDKCEKTKDETIKIVECEGAGCKKEDAAAAGGSKAPLIIGGVVAVLAGVGAYMYCNKTDKDDAMAQGQEGGDTEDKDVEMYAVKDVTEPLILAGHGPATYTDDDCGLSGG